MNALATTGHSNIKQVILLILFTASIILFAVSSVRAEGLIEADLRIPATFKSKSGNQTVQLVAYVVRPDDWQKHPLVIINHGSPRKPEDRINTSPNNFIPQAIEFARRGWTAVILIRRGFGKSEAIYAEIHGDCNNPNFTAQGQETAEEIRQAIAWLIKQPYVQPDTIMSVGQSTGGFGTVALTANPPEGLVAAINFAGGRGSSGPDTNCSEKNLVKAFQNFGERSRVPMLWIYSKNDHFFGPDLAIKLHKSFTAGGGNARLIQPPPFGNDGHNLFVSGIPAWTPYIDDFLKEQGLLRHEPLISASKNSAASPPDGLSRSGLADFKKYLAEPWHKAFAVSNNNRGGYGWSSRRGTIKESENGAIANCEKHNNKCTVYMVEDKLSE